MGYFATDTFEPATPLGSDPGSARQHPVCGQKPPRAPIHNAIYGYRSYNSELGRWINRNPIEERGGLNLYGFLANGSVWSFEYLGLGEWKLKRERVFLSDRDQARLRDYDTNNVDWSGYCVMFYPDPGECEGEIRISQFVTVVGRFFRCRQLDKAVDNNDGDPEGRHYPPWAAWPRQRRFDERQADDGTPLPTGVGIVDDPRPQSGYEREDIWSEAHIVAACCKDGQWKVVGALTIRFTPGGKLEGKDGDAFKAVRDNEPLRLAGQPDADRRWYREVERWLRR